MKGLPNTLFLPKVLLNAVFATICAFVPALLSAQDHGHDQSAPGHTHDSAQVAAIALDNGAVAEHAAEAAPAADHKEKFNAGKLIKDHIGDEHGSHLWAHTSLPLPVILYNSERGLSVFSSSRFDHGHKTYGGYALHEGHVVAVNDPEAPMPTTPR